MVPCEKRGRFGALNCSCVSSVGSPVAVALSPKRYCDTVEAAKLKVPIAEAFALARANKAHERLAEGHVLGKMVLRTQLS